MSQTATPPVLVAGIDGSGHGLVVARVAQRLADQLGLGLVLVHIAHHEKHYLVGEKRRNVLESGARLLRSIAEHAGLEGHFRLHTGLGDPATELLALADEVGAEVLVVGSRGRGLLRSSLLGSVSQETVTRARCPVVVVPPALATDWKGVECIVVGIDDADTADTVAASAGALARRLAARLVLVHVAQSPALASAAAGYDLAGGPYKALLDAERQAGFQMLIRAASQAGHASRAQLIFEVGDPATEIERVASDVQANLIIVGSPGPGRLHQVVQGGLDRRLVAGVACPVVVIPTNTSEPDTIPPPVTRNGHQVAASAPGSAAAVESA